MPARAKGILKKALPLFIVISSVLLASFFLHSMILAKQDTIEQLQAQEKSSEKSFTNVVTMAVEPGLIREKINLPGQVKPWISLEVVSEVTGKIVQKKISKGQTVNKGDILAVIDKRDYQNAYDGALAAYESATATERRLKALVKKNFVTQSQLDDAVAGVKTTKAALNNARLNLNRCTILSPMQGIVDRIHIENGTYLNSGDPVATILEIDKLKIEVGIPESDVAAVRKLDTFDITIDALGDRNYMGFSHYLYKTSDSFARLYNLEIRLDNPDQQILPDMFVRVGIVKHQDPAGLAVPMYALVTMNQIVGVFVEKDGFVRFTPVQTGFLDGWKIQIQKGLSPNDHVVVVGHRIIEDGEQVHVTKVIKDMKELIR